MYDTTARTDYVKSEMDYRLGRIQTELASHRKRRSLRRRSRDVDGLTWTTVR